MFNFDSLKIKMKIVNYHQKVYSSLLNKIKFPHKEELHNLITKSTFSNPTSLLYKLEEYIEDEEDIQNKKSSCLLLGSIYFRGINTKVEKDKGIVYLKRSDLPDSYLIIAIYYWERKEYQEAKEYFEKMAKNKFKKAYPYLSEIYFKGLGCEVNYVNSRKYAEMSLQNSSCLLYLGKIYLEGLDIKKDIKKGISYLEASSSLGNLESKAFLGVCLLTGKYGVKINEKLGLEYLLEKSLSGAENQFSFFPLAQFYESKKDFEKAIMYYEKAFQNGDENAASVLGYMYYKGYGVQQNFEKSLVYLESIKNEQSNSCYLKYKIYQKGTSEQKKKAFKQLQRAAELLHPTASKILSFVYKTGRVLSPDPNKSLELLLAACEMNDPESMMHLGRQYLEDPKKELEAVALLKRSLELGCDYSKIHLGIYYFRKGKYQEAREYLGSSSQRYANITCGYLGELYYKGLGVEKNLQKAKTYFTMGVSLKNQRCISRLCEMYKHGIGVPLNEEKSIALNEISKSLIDYE